MKITSIIFQKIIVAFFGKKITCFKLTTHILYVCNNSNKFRKAIQYKFFKNSIKTIKEWMEDIDGN